jgi:hypothetical protein
MTVFEYTTDIHAPRVNHTCTWQSLYDSLHVVGVLRILLELKHVTALSKPSTWQPAWNRGRALPQTFKMVSATVPRQGIPPDLVGKWPPTLRLHMQQVHALHAVSSMACFTPARTRKHKHMARLALPSSSSTIAPQPLPTAQGTPVYLLY